MEQSSSVHTYRGYKQFDAINISDSNSHRTALESTYSKFCSSVVVNDLVGGTGQAGNMFDVLPLKIVLITGLDLQIDFDDDVTIERYTKLETFRGHENLCSNWTLVATRVVLGKGRDR
jgi:hypothetical protein